MALATPKRRCDNCGKDKPKEGFIRLGTEFPRQDWICTDCQKTHPQGAFTKSAPKKADE